MYINRQCYLDRLISYKDKDVVKVITGIRRSGKSVLLFNIYYDYLISIGVDIDHIIRINLEAKKMTFYVIRMHFITLYPGG